MGVIRDHIRCKLVMPLLMSDLSLLEAVTQDLVHEWGDIDYSGEPFLFEQTAYYNEEMGIPIYKAFYSFKDLIDATELVRVKHVSNNLEDKYARANKRKVNLDPGYMSPGKFVLATTKNQQHRLYMGEGIYEEITLYFHAGEWKPHPWTYSDYRTELYRDILASIRKIYLSQVEADLKIRSKK